MTTKVHIVNFGPDQVMIRTVPGASAVVVQPQKSVDLYVWQGQTLEITELKVQPL